MSFTVLHAFKEWRGLPSETKKVVLSELQSMVPCAVRYRRAKDCEAAFARLQMDVLWMPAEYCGRLQSLMCPW